LKLLEATALRGTALSALHLGVEVLRGPTAGRALRIEALRALLRAGLAAGVLLLVSLRLLASFLLNLLRVHVVPGAGGCCTFCQRNRCSGRRCRRARRTGSPLAVLPAGIFP